MYIKDLDILNFIGTKEELEEHFIDLIKETQEELDQDYFHMLISSIKSRVEAVIVTKGYYT